MKLDALTPKKSSKTLQKMLESRFNLYLNLDTLQKDSATGMLQRATSNMQKLKENYGSLAVQKPKYIKQRLIAETLRAYLNEGNFGYVFESDTDEAEVVLAAQNMVDKITGFLEDVGEMQNQQLLPVVDQIRASMGEDQASAYQQQVENALSSCLDALKKTREELVSAQGIVTGTSTPDMGADMGTDLPTDDDMGADLDLDADLDIEDGDNDVDAEIDLDIDDDEFGASPAATGDLELAGREKREV